MGESLVLDFKRSVVNDRDMSQSTPWKAFDPARGQTLARVWAVDGSFVSVQSQERPSLEVAFVKTALITIDRAKLDLIDKDDPHRLHLQDVMTGSGLFHATVFPLKEYPEFRKATNYDRVRHIIRDSVSADEEGAFYDTLKWLAYQKWLPSRQILRGV